MKNLFNTLGLARDGEQSEVIIDSESVKLERLVSFGHPTPEGFWYDQQQTEWVALIKGEAELAYADGRTVKMKAGDHLTIAPHVVHRVSSVSDDAVWLALFI